MESKDRQGGSGLLRVELVRGEPYHVAGRTLTPVARVVSIGRARATVGTNRVGGWGGAFTWVKPVAVLDDAVEVPIYDGTGAALRGMVVAAIALSLFFAALRWLSRRLRAQHPQSIPDC